MKCSIASRTRGSVGVVACISKYMGLVPSSITVACFKIPAAGLIIASAEFSKPGILRSLGNAPVCVLKASWSAFMVLSMLTSALSGLVDETYDLRNSEF